jgi:hypothetical protein
LQNIQDVVRLALVDDETRAFNFRDHAMLILATAKFLQPYL